MQKISIVCSGKIVKNSNFFFLGDGLGLGLGIQLSLHNQVPIKIIKYNKYKKNSL